MGDVFEFGGVVAVIMAAVFVWKWSNVWIRRFDRDSKATPRLRDLETRIAELEDSSEHYHADAEHRITELEERLDFAERLLGQQGERPPLPPPK